MSATAEDKDAIIAALRERQAARDVAFDERAAHQAATIDVLKAMSASPGDPQPVFDLIVQQVVTLLDTQSSMLFEYDGALLHFRADAGTADLLGRDVMDEFLRGYPLAPHRGIVSGRAILDAAVVHVRDLTADPDRSEAMRALPYRSQISVPLLRDGRPIGVLTSASPRVDSFNQAQVELLKTFAEQAVIAITSAETWRALQVRTADLQESLEYQTATSDVLNVISRSTFDLGPVLDTLMETAARICDADMAFIFRRHGDIYKLESNWGFPPEFEAFLKTQALAPGRASITQRTALEGRIIHVHDMAADPEYALPKWEMGGVRTGLGVPLARDGIMVGVIDLARRGVRPFSKRQIELVTTFADQAVIAMENARLLTEQREALERQTAMAEVLRITNENPGDLKPVFDAVMEHSLRLVGAAFGALYSYDGERFHMAAIKGVPPEFEDYRRRHPQPIGADSPPGQLLATKRPVQVADNMTHPFFVANPDERDAQIRLGGVRAVLALPLLKDGAVVGQLVIYRKDPGNFPDKQIALLENFAAQAVIAMENARLLTETREALEQQTATAEVLQIINESPETLQPVFDAMLEKAMLLCGVAFGFLSTWDGEVRHVVAARGLPPAMTEYATTRVASTPSPGVLRVFETRRPHQVLDLMADDGYRNGHPDSRAIVDLGGVRTCLHVPLVKDDGAVGIFSFYRRDVREFSGKEVALLENFAAQAVIAMENARLLTEQREALEQQTATAEVLQVINASPGDLTPVFEAILEKAHRICRFDHGGLALFDGTYFRSVATRGFGETGDAMSRVPYPPSGAQRLVMRGARYGHIPDISAFTADSDDAKFTGFVALTGFRATLLVPLRKDGAVIGHISGWRLEPGPFSDKEIALLENFAAQAVIAMDNARLLTEQREALERQTAITEVLAAINASPGDLAPVFETILHKALRSCGATIGNLFGFHDDRVRLLASVGLSEEARAIRWDFLLPGAGHPMRRIREEKRPVQVPDVADEAFAKIDPDWRRTYVEISNVRAFLNVPLLKDGEAIGLITILRREPGVFPDQQVALLENFAAQAVIAMENARLLTETQEALERQTAMAEVLQVINANPGNLQPVFDSILERAHRICKVSIGNLGLYDGKQFRAVSLIGYGPTTEAFLRTGFDRNPVHAPLFRGEVMHIRDRERYAWTPETEAVNLGYLREAGLNTNVMVPLFKDGAMLGYISAARREIAPFSDREIALLENFAAQAVIAMENARLLTELRESLEQQTAMADVLRVINLNPGDVRPVFDAILSRAHRMGKADRGALALYDGGVFRVHSTFGYSPETEAYLRAGVPTGPIYEPLLRGERVYIPDREEAAMPESELADWLDSRSREEFFDYLRRAGVSVYLLVPLYKDGTLLGMISANRHEARPFSEKEIALLENFAAQAVIAVDNARLLNEIRQRQVELDITFENMGDGVAMFDAERKLAAWNRNFQDILDLPDDAVRVGLPFTDYIRGLAERGEYGPDASADEQIVRLAAVLDNANRFERTRPNGHVIDVRQNPIPGGGFVVIYADITERKRAEEALRAARDEAETALRDLKLAQANLVQAEKMASLGQLTAGIAHEIKNPLNFVNNFASLSVELLDELKETAAPAFATLDDDARADAEDLTETLTSNLKKIEEHGKRADGIVRSMLEHSRGSSAERRAVDINDLVDEALNLAYHGARAQDQSFNITLERDLAPGIAPVTLAPQDMTRVLLNLIGNGFYAARKRRDAGVVGFEPTLKVATRDLGDAVEFRVRDNGIGIPHGIRDKLFQPFFTTKPTGEGTGLGLSITWDIVTKAHAGTITVDSEPGDHTEFTVTLPRHAAEAARP